MEAWCGALALLCGCVPSSTTVMVPAICRSARNRQRLSQANELSRAVHSEARPPQRGNVVGTNRRVRTKRPALEIPG